MGYLDHEWKLDEAIAVAREEESKKRAIKVAKKMKAVGKSVNEILELTDLPIEDVLQL